MSFEYFIILAEMRTGSNLLEETINSIPGLKCWGEAFNPVFIGHSNQEEMLGVTKAMREQDPMALLARMKEETSGLAGFRFFHDHDPRILSSCIADPRCAKIVLTRNPIESYVSRKIAEKTGQWRLGDMRHAKSAQVIFDPAEFEEHLSNLQEFQVGLMHDLQTSGQTGFYISYEDVQDADVVNGLARYLGVDVEKTEISKKTKVQNPSSLEQKVVNFNEMETSLARLDRFNLARTPNFEPRRGPVVPTYVAAAEAPLLYLPVRCGLESQVEEWLADCDGVGPEGLRRGFTQKTLRQWKRQAGAHRSFTVLRHPVARLHSAFVEYILKIGDATYVEIRDTLRTTYKLPIPADTPDDSYDVAAHRAAFLGFCEFIKGNLNGQTSIRVDPVWASQFEIVSGFAQFNMPDMLIRDDQLASGLEFVCVQVGVAAPDLKHPKEEHPVSLGAIYNKQIENAVRAAYQRDYMMFGFKGWAGPSAD